MNDLKTTTKLVKYILETERQARNSDSFLYLKVLQHLSKTNGTDILYMPVCDFLNNMHTLSVPPFESVRRSRQKLQAEYPDLASCKTVETARMENEKTYREYARSTVC